MQLLVGEELKALRVKFIGSSGMIYASLNLMGRYGSGISKALMKPSLQNKDDYS